MKAACLAAVTLAMTACGDDVEKYDNWPDWKVPSELTINGIPLNDSYYDNYFSQTVHFENGAEVEFSDINDISGIINAGFFEYISPQKARFLGATGDYDVNYDATAKLLYVERHDGEFPDGLWVCGRGYSHPQSTVTAGDGTMNGGPASVPYMIADVNNRGVYVTTLYLDKSFRFKFYKQRAIGDCIVYDDPELGIKSRNSLVMAGNSSGDFCAGPMFTPGVYTVTLDIPAGICRLSSDNGDIEFPVFSINGVELGVEGDVTTMLGAKLNLHKGDRLKFDGFDDITTMLPKGMIDAVSATEAVFSGTDGDYTIYYDLNDKLIYAVNTSMSYPDALWLCGDGIGHPAASSATATAWSFDSPGDAFQLVKVDDDVYEGYVYLGSDFRFKLYPGHKFDDEINAVDNDPLPANMLAKSWISMGYGGYFNGDFAPGADFRPGTYRLRVDVANHTCQFADHSSHTGKVAFKINGTEMTQDAQADFISCILTLKKGDELKFDGFTNLDNMLEPIYFEGAGDTYRFKGADGKYKLLYSPKRELIYCKIEGDSWEDRYFPNCLWITGVGVGHPLTCNHTGTNLSSWNFDDPRDYMIAMPTADGVYEIDVFLDGGFMMRFYYGHTDWGHTFDAKMIDTDPEYWCHWAGKDIKSENFGPGTGFEVGSYHLKLDVNKKLLTYTPLK